MIVILNVLNAIWPYVVAVLMFILLIVIHEFGHFILAKATGVKVNKFAVGFGPKLFGKTWGETEYRVNLIPLGGYCAMEGEDETSSNPRAFCNAKAYKRFLIVAAGAVFNLVLGFIIVAIVLSYSRLLSTTTVAKFTENAKSQKSGLMVGDEIVKVGDRRVFTTQDLGYTFTNVEGDSVDITVIRNGKEKLLPNVRFETSEIEEINVLNIDFWVLGEEKTFTGFIKATFKTTVSYGRIVWMSLWDLITGKYGISALSGPVGLTKVIGETTAAGGLKDLLPILGLITVNLGIFNLLPLPALDGGRLFFILVEMIIRKPIPKKFEGLVHAAGFVLLMGFMLLITAKDIWMLIVG